MKKKYEKFSFLYFSTFLFFLCLLVLVYVLFHFKFKTYQVYNATISKENTIDFRITTDMLQRLQKNKSILIQGKKYLIEEKNIVRNMIKKDGHYYHQVTLQVQITFSYHVLDMIEIRIYKQEEPLICLFNVFWKGVENAKIKE